MEPTQPSHDGLLSTTGYDITTAAASTTEQAAQIAATRGSRSAAPSCLMLAVGPAMDGDFPPHELPPPGGGIQLQVRLALDLKTTQGT